MKSRKSSGPAVRELGEPNLRRRSSPVKDLDEARFRSEERDLHAALAAFRRTHGFGRAIAAPQIGVNRRFIAMNLGHGAFTLVNPRFVWRSRERIRMWDDCMSFPDLLVNVARHRSVSLAFTDGTGRRLVWERVSTDIAELLQHEVDHLDGILAVDRALSRDAIVTRTAFDRHRRTFEARADYRILPTLSVNGGRAASSRRIAAPQL